MKQLLILTVVVLGFGFTQNAQACRNKKVVKTQKSQVKRIKQGVKSGELTKAEARNLRKDQKAISQMRKEAKRDDGKIDKSEMKDLRLAQSKMAKKIYRKKHNLRDRN